MDPACLEVVEPVDDTPLIPAQAMQLRHQLVTLRGLVGGGATGATNASGGHCSLKGVTDTIASEHSSWNSQTPA